MPQSSNISNYCTVTENEDLDDNNNYIIHDECAEKSIENDNTVDDTTYFRMRYMVPKESPLGIYLDNVKTKLKKMNNLKNKNLSTPIQIQFIILEVNQIHLSFTVMY